MRWYLTIVDTTDFQARSDLIKYQFQRDHSGHRLELGLDRIRVDVGKPSYCRDPCGHDGNLHQTGGHEEMRREMTPEHVFTDWI